MFIQNYFKVLRWNRSLINVLNKWNESGFRPLLCTYRLNWARRTSWGWWDDWDDTVLQTQDSKFEPWRSEAEHATSRSRRLPTILTFTRGWGRNFFVSFKPPKPDHCPAENNWHRPFRFFLVAIELVRELLFSNMHKKFEQDKWKTFHVIAPTGSNYWRKMRKIAINRPF